VPRVVVVSNIPTPNNDALFAELARQPGLTLQVLYGASREANRAWRLDDAKGYPYAVLPGWTLGGSAHVNPGVLRAIARFAPDVALLTGSYTMPTVQIALAALTVRRTPWVYWGEELQEGPLPAPARVARAALRRPLRLATGVLAIGSRARRSYARAGIAPARIADFRYYADAEHFRLPPDERASARAAVRAGLGIAPDAVVFLYVGQFIVRKRVDTLLRAFARVAGDAPHAAVLLAGDGPERDALASLAARLGIAERVHRTGFVQPAELPRVFAAADALVLPSAQEGWGVVVGEALAAGLPVLASDAVNAAADLVQPGVTGWHFPVDDDARLSEAMAPLLADPARRAIMADAARAAVRDEAPAVAARRLALLLEAARDGRPLAEL
jgi:glycosyltransferase involved in cell wall biosynthesis